jgi:RNA polymerase sigma-70 factor, ECF subfamily
VSTLEKQDLRTDEELFRSWIDGKQDCFENLLARYQGRLYKVILGWTKNPHLSQDLFQETWVRVIEHRADFDPAKKFSTWVFAIALNLTRDHWRREKRAQTDIDSERTELEPSKTDLSRELIEKEQMQRLQNALTSLSDIEREVFMLRQFGDMSFSEIAAMLDINLNTALSRMHQACNRLKELVGEKS